MVNQIPSQELLCPLRFSKVFQSLDQLVQLIGCQRLLTGCVFQQVDQPGAVKQANGQCPGFCRGCPVAGFFADPEPVIQRLFRLL